MNQDLDRSRLAEIPDPFAGAARAPEARTNPARLPRSPARVRTRSLRGWSLVGAVVFDAAWVAFVERRPDLTTAPAIRLAIGLAAPLAAGALAVGAVTARGPSGLGETKARVASVVLASPLLFAASAVLAESPAAPDAHFWRHALGCLAVTIVLAGGPLVLAIVAFRHAFAVAPAWRAAGLGVASGAIAAATMALVCPIDGASHALLGHGAIFVLAALASAVVGGRACRA
jgi:hypothetical protein